MAYRISIAIGETVKQNANSLMGVHESTGRIAEEKGLDPINSDGMKRTEYKDAEAGQLANILCSGSSASMVNNMLDDLPQEEVQELCTTILKNGHTIVHLLAQRQKLSALQAVLERGVDVNTRDAQGATPLHVALHHNALFAAKILLDHGANPSEIVSRSKGTTLLHLMVTCDRPHAVLLLLQEKADANARDANDRTPFHLAAIYGNAVIAAILMRHEKCDVNAVDGSGHTGVMLAIINNNQELARQLVEAPGMDIVRRDRDGMSCLHLAVSLGQLEVVRSLLRRNTANINSKEHRMGRTPIHFACALCCGKDGVACSNLLAKNASSGDSEDVSDNPDSLNNTAATEDGSNYFNNSRIDVVDLAPDSVNDVQKANLPSVSMSVKPLPGSGAAAKMQPLVNGFSTPRTPRAGSLSARTPRTSTPRTSTPRAFTPRQLSAKREDNAVEASPRRKTRTSVLDVNSLFQSRHSISCDHLARVLRSSNQQNYFVSTPTKGRRGTATDVSRRPSTAPVTSNLHRQFNATFPVSQLVFKIPTASTGRDSAASHRSRDSVIVALTPFNVGAVRCRLVALLLDHGADANLMTTFRKSPLHITSIMGAADVMSLLLPNITNINVLSAGNKTALHLAVEGGFTSLASQLIQGGTNLGMRDISGMTALHLAAKLGHYDIATFLLKAKADKNCCDFRQMMPLHHACLRKHADIAELLIRAGACLDRTDDDGFLPLDYQRRGNMPEKPTTPAGRASVTGKCDPFSTSSQSEDMDSTGFLQTPLQTPRQDMSQRRRKLGVIHSMSGNGVPPTAMGYQRQHDSAVLCNGSA